MPDATPHIGHRRSSSWWEPIFNPDLDGKLTVCDWIFPNNAVPEKAYLPANLLKARMTSGEVYKLDRLIFSECDFQGNFDHRPSILIDRCRFHNCDFAFSDWRFTTFRNCEFRDCSISLAAFSDCEFRDCNWERMGFSGNKTNFDRCFIMNPRELVSAGFSTTNLQDKSKRHADYQWYRLEGTKANLARTLLYSHQIVGDDKTYYQTARLHDLQQVWSRISKSVYDWRHGTGLWKHLDGLRVILGSLELALLWIVGLINSWGSRLLQPLLSLFVTFAIFGLIYCYLPVDDAVAKPWQKSFDITVLAGYTNQSNMEQPLHLRMLEGIQILASVLLYTIFFSTAVARFSRTR